MADLERLLHDRDLPDLIAIALAHYQFETVHPFVDGNGRIGLMLIERASSNIRCSICLLI